MVGKLTTLRVEEPSEPEVGAILIADAQNNDIAEFFHCEHATVPQSYEAALSLARMSAAAPALLKAAQRALAVLKAQGESVRPGAVTGALDAAIRAATGEHE